MYFHRPAASGVRVLKIASRLDGASTAKSEVAASGTIGAGASAISSALVRVSTPSRVEKTMNFRCDFFMAPPISGLAPGEGLLGNDDAPNWLSSRPIKRGQRPLQWGTSA